MTELHDITASLREFASDREWDQFHTPKNLAMALSVEASEIVELYQWHKHGSDKQPDREKLKHEVADVGIYLIMLADKLDINLLEAMEEKIEINGKKYPVSECKGSAKKAT